METFISVIIQLIMVSIALTLTWAIYYLINMKEEYMDNENIEKIAKFVYWNLKNLDDKNVKWFMFSEEERKSIITNVNLIDFQERKSNEVYEENVLKNGGYFDV